MLTIIPLRRHLAESCSLFFLSHKFSAFSFGCFIFFLVCVSFFLHVLLERLPFVTSRAWSVTHLVSLAVSVIVLKVAGFHFSGCIRFAYLYGVVFICYQKKKKKNNASDSVGCRGAKRQPVKVSTGFDLVFILEQIGSNVIDKKKKKKKRSASNCVFFL